MKYYVFKLKGSEEGLILQENPFDVQPGEEVEIEGRVYEYVGEVEAKNLPDLIEQLYKLSH